MKSKLEALLEEKGACYAARDWAKAYKTPYQAWQKCTNPQWLLWAIRALGVEDSWKQRQVAILCVREIWPLLTDERSRQGVIVAERFQLGEATEEELAAAYAAADAVRAAAPAAAHAAYAAADAVRAAA